MKDMFEKYVNIKSYFIFGQSIRLLLSIIGTLSLILLEKTIIVIVGIIFVSTTHFLSVTRHRQKD